LPFSLNGDPLGNNITIIDVEWKMFSTYSPEDGIPPILDLSYLVDHCNNPPVQLCTLRGHTVSYGSTGNGNYGGINPAFPPGSFATAGSVDWQNDLVGIGGYVLKAIYTIQDLSSSFNQ
jgi:hypothetical protein